VPEDENRNGHAKDHPPKPQKSMAHIEDHQCNHRADLEHGGHDAGIEDIGLDGMHDDDHDDGPQCMPRAGGIDGHEHDGRRGNKRAEHRDQTAEKDHGGKQRNRLDAEHEQAQRGHDRIERGDEHLGSKPHPHHHGETHHAAGRHVVNGVQPRSAKRNGPGPQSGQVEHDKKTKKRAQQKGGNVRGNLGEGGDDQSKKRFGLDADQGLQREIVLYLGDGRGHVRHDPGPLIEPAPHGFQGLGELFEEGRGFGSEFG